MSAPAFDPWAALARIQREMGAGGAPPPFPPPPPISRISGISRGAPLETERGAAPEAPHHDPSARAERPYLPGDPDPLRDGLHAGALQRPTAWADPTLRPPPGAWCSCCGRFERKGGRWWTERENPTGWACATCHPPVHLAPETIEEVMT